MKKLLFFLLVLGAVQVKAQAIKASINTIIKGSIELRDSTINRSIPLEVTAGAKAVKYDIKVYADVGEITVTLTEPSGKKSFNVTLGTKTSSGGHEPSKGEMSDYVIVKIPGTWNFYIRAENATGTISYQIETIKP
jgi:hypothetical protein